MKPHKWAKEIKAWADGAEIEHRMGNKWLECKTPQWGVQTDYRIKPTPEQAEEERIRKMAERALAIPEISDAVDRLFEAFKEPQYLYVWKDGQHNITLTTNPPHPAQNTYNIKVMGKIKLEVDDE